MRMNVAEDRDLEEPVEGLGRRLKLARDRAGLSQADLGEKVGRRGQSIWRYETERSAIEGRLLVRIADVLGVSPTWLVSGRFESTPTDTVSEGIARYLLARDDKPTEPTPTLASFLETPEGASITRAERDLLEQYQQGGFVKEPTVLSMHYFLQAMRAEKEPV